MVVPPVDSLDSLPSFTMPKDLEVLETPNPQTLGVTIAAMAHQSCQQMSKLIAGFLGSL